ncbi:DNA-damage-inducible SOS response protein [Klebsiella pneumoniae]|nr:DNA-damage-inducible SOS response protein [Klebsiella aerogenes]STV29424.1 DNA-damage-inducible SOS response protein [Klebsiella pneumoniae]
MLLNAADKALWRLALPMIFSNITVPLLGLVDTAVIGHLDSPVYLGGVAVGRRPPVSSSCCCCSCA